MQINPFFHRLNPTVKLKYTLKKRLNNLKALNTQYTLIPRSEV